jgi:hypothetical protein
MDMNEPKPPRRADDMPASRATDRGLGLFILVALASAVLILVAAAIWFWRG